MRGALGKYQNLMRYSGITPAYAGSTQAAYYLQAGPQDHPRVCGEHQLSSAVGSLGEGSPPRMRGAHGRFRPIIYNEGITPAYAGSTVGLPAAFLLSRDHPRVCGEHTVKHFIPN